MFKGRISRLLIGTALSALPMAAAAQTFDFTPDTTRILSDPAFLPLTGQIYGVTDYTYTDVHGTSRDFTGALQSMSREWSDQIRQTLAYGITDDLSVGANIAYDPFDEHKRELVGGGSVIQKDSGFADPTFNITWRAFDQAVQPVNLDLFGSYSPDWITAKTATSTDDGTIARGGQAGSVGVALSHVTRSFTIYGSFAADLSGRTKVENPTNDAVTETGSRTDYTLALDTQTRFTDRLSLNAGLAHVWNASATVFNSASDVTHLNQPENGNNLRVALNYHLVPNTVVASLTYGRDFQENTRNVFPALEAANDSLRSRDANLYGAKLDYVFP